jgi:hypothetical protein
MSELHCAGEQQGHTAHCEEVREREPPFPDHAAARPVLQVEPACARSTRWARSALGFGAVYVMSRSPRRVQRGNCF